MAIVVSDTSPIRALHHLDALVILEKLYDRVLVPDAVARELARATRRFQSFQVSEHAFLKVVTPIDRAHVIQLEEHLDPGEASALVLALEQHADYVLVDERAGRKAAQQLGLTVIGVLGLLSEAKNQGFIGPIAPMIERLQRELDFRLSPGLISEVLRQANE